MTDDARELDRLAQRFGDRVVHTDCQRTRTDTGIHLSADADRSRLGSCARLFERANRRRRPLCDFVAFVDPDLDADAAQGGAGLCGAVVDVCFQRVQGHPALALLVFAGHV